MTPCPLPLVALAAHETCPRCGRPAREHRGHPAYEEETMTETTEPTREQIEGRIAYLETLVRLPEHAVGWDTDLAVYRMALRTLDAEAQLAAMTERAEKAERERDVASSSLRGIVSELRDALGDFPMVGERWTDAVKRLRADLARVTAERDEAIAIYSVSDHQRDEACRDRDRAMAERDAARADLANAERERDEAQHMYSVILESRSKAEDDSDAANKRAARAEASIVFLRAKLDHERKRIDAFDARDARTDETIAALSNELAAMTERAERAERLSATLRAVAEQKVADAIVKYRERATRVGWIDHATGDYEERSVDIPMDDLAVGSAVCAFLRMVGAWTLEDRAEKSEREQDEATKRAEKSEREWYEAFDRGRAKGREDVAKYSRAVGEIEAALGIGGAVPMRYTVSAVRSALHERDTLRAKLSNMHRRAQRAESATAAARREAIGQRKRADWWRREAKRLWWTPDCPELREGPTSDARLDCESSSLLLLSTWARKVMMRPKNREKQLPPSNIRTLLWMARDELFEAYTAIEENAPTDDILAELGDAATCIAFAMREVEKRRKA